jgi:hypothetical protein
MALTDPRTFAAGVPSVRGEEPLLIGLIGPPGGGKTFSALRLATGMRTVRPGPVVLIDTEGGRSRKYSPPPGQKASLASHTFEFLRVDMTPPFRSHDFLAAIKAQLPLNPAAIIIDTMSDEHEGEGGYLEFHDEIVNTPKGKPGYVGGNEWAAWSAPKAARKRLISGLMQIKAPLLFTFRAREKTKTEPGRNGGKDRIVNIGFMPVAPLEIVHTLDLTCILPPRADGVPVWTSDKVGEDFVVKLPAFLAPLIQEGALSEATGAALARWAMGEAAASAPAPSGVQAGGQPGKKALLDEMGSVLTAAHGQDREKRSAALELAFGTWSKRDLEKLDEAALQKGLAALKMNMNPAAHMEREPGIDPGTEPGEEAIWEG